MAIVKTNSQNYSSIANAIRAKGVSGTFYPSEMATAISNIPTGIPKSGVVFIDYDGTVIETWDVSDVASKTALPSNPTGHTRLVAEGWNWSLDDIKSYMANYPEAVMTVGQMYHTSSGKTELDITVTKVTRKTVTCNISGTKDWGDGTTNTSSSHTYTEYGDYTIKCSGTTISSNIFGTSSGVYNYSCTAAHIASGVTGIGNQAFFLCHSLTSVTIPESVTSFGNTTFQGNYSLISVTIPDNVISIGYQSFFYCYSLTSISIPNSIIDVGSSMLSNCYSLTSVAIPDNIINVGSAMLENCYSLTSISMPINITDTGSSMLSKCYSLTSVSMTLGLDTISEEAFSNCSSLISITMPPFLIYIRNKAFSNCYSCIKYDFSLSDEVPNLIHTNVFEGINRICKIIVPDALYDSWKAATNWSTYANYIYKVSEVTD